MTRTGIAGRVFGYKHVRHSDINFMEALAVKLAIKSGKMGHRPTSVKGGRIGRHLTKCIKLFQTRTTVAFVRCKKWRGYTPGRETQKLFFWIIICKLTKMILIRRMVGDWSENLGVYT